MINAPAPKQEQPTFFTGTSFAVEEIKLGLNVLTAKVRDLEQGNRVGSAVQQKLAAEKIAEVSGQIKILADTLARVSISHLNRRPRP